MASVSANHPSTMRDFAELEGVNDTPEAKGVVFDIFVIFCVFHAKATHQTQQIDNNIFLRYYYYYLILVVDGRLERSRNRPLHGFLNYPHVQGLEL